MVSRNVNVIFRQFRLDPTRDLFAILSVSFKAFLNCNDELCEL